MAKRTSRRQFLGRSARIVAGVGATPLLAAAVPPESAARDLCLSCRDAHLKEVGEKDCWSALGAIGAKGVEARVWEDLSVRDLFHPEKTYSIASPDKVKELAADMKSSGCRLSAFCLFNRFDERPEFESDWCVKTARAAKALGVPAIRIDVVPRKLAGRAFLDFCVGELKKLVAATESTGVAFAIENHGKTTNDPEFLKPLFERVGSKRLGLTLDTGNFYWFGHPLSKVHQLFESFASRVHHTHCKSIRYPKDEREKRRPMGWEYGQYNCPIYEGDIDLRRLVKVLRDAGYANDLCIENEALGKYPQAERRRVLEREVRHLRELL